MPTIDWTNSTPAAARNVVGTIARQDDGMMESTDAWPEMAHDHLAADPTSRTKADRSWFLAGTRTE